MCLPFNLFRAFGPRPLICYVSSIYCLLHERFRGRTITAGEVPYTFYLPRIMKFALKYGSKSRHYSLNHFLGPERLFKLQKRRDTIWTRIPKLTRFFPAFPYKRNWGNRVGNRWWNYSQQMFQPSIMWLEVNRARLMSARIHTRRWLTRKMFCQVNGKNR